MIDELKKLNPNCLYYKNCINNIVIEVLANVGGRTANVGGRTANVSVPKCNECNVGVLDTTWRKNYEDDEPY